jgi:hypothetical protein
MSRNPSNSSPGNFQIKASGELAKKMRDIRKALTLTMSHVSWLRKVANQFQVLEEMQYSTRMTSAKQAKAGTAYTKVMKLLRVGPPNKPSLKDTTRGKPELAKSLLRVAKRVNLWIEDEVDGRYVNPAMTEMSFDDAADHLLIGVYLQKGNFRKAAEIAYGMDTAAREEIPMKAFDFLMRKLELGGNISRDW